MSQTDSNTLSPDDRDTVHKEIERLRKEVAYRQARTQAAEAETRCFRELAEHIREVFWMTNPLGDELIYISPAYEHIWGDSCDCLYKDPGRRLAWVHDDDRERVLIAFKRDAASGAYNETYRIQRPDGAIRWIRDRAFPVRNADGDIYRLAGFAIDLTEHVEAHDRRTELQNLIAMRERISVFAALGTGLAHDIGQPLTATRNFLSQARRQAEQTDDALADLLARSERQLERASDIVAHLRDFAREGRPTVTRQPLYPLLSEVRHLLEPVLRAERVVYIGPSEAELADVELPLDRVFTQQMLRNLIGNAIEALANHDERRVTVQVDTDHEKHVDIHISDTGSGIDDDLELFTPFATSKANGLGLGLSVSRSLARSHGGDLFVASRGNGDQPTCFILRLPRRRLQNTRRANAAGAGSA